MVHKTLAIPLRGSCACKRVTYSSTVLPQSTAWCHCTTCRSISGAPFLPFAEFPSKEIRFYEDGKEVSADLVDGLVSSVNSTKSLYIFALSDIALRVACRYCHSHLAMRYHSTPDAISVTVGTIDLASLDDEGRKSLNPSSQIFYSQRAQWYKVPAMVPCYNRFSPNFDPN